MQKPSKRLRKLLERATARYAEELPQALSYLQGRGIEEATAQRFRLGFVSTPEPGHEQYAGRLAIPYIDALGVYGLKFRCTVHADCKSEQCTKYLALPGQEVGVYNVIASDSLGDTIHVSEGELDCLILTQVFPDSPVVGIPGAQLWKPHHAFHFSGFERVLLWMDGDKAGTDLGNRIRHDVRTAEIVSIPKGKDVTDLYLDHGAEVLRQMVGEDEEEE